MPTEGPGLQARRGLQGRARQGPWGPHYSTSPLNSILPRKRARGCTSSSASYTASPSSVAEPVISRVLRAITVPRTLPSIDNSRDWLRQSQRFPVIVGFDARQDPALPAALRVGGQASVIAYGEGSGILRLLGKLYIRAASMLSYAY